MFVIISLIISSTAMGLFFNLNFDVYKLIKTKSALIEVPEALADVASTTVEVKNSPPVISVPPAESPSSTSTTPVNVGDNISIQVTATDGEGNQYYLLICSTNSVIPDSSGGESHHCGDITFGSSTIANSGAQATTTFAVADPTPSAESDEWYAFVCDNHATQADCSSASQGLEAGSGDSSSPFYINHAPVFSAANTTADDKNPGNALDPFEVTATVTDGDIAGGNDILTIYVCGSEGWSISSGCAGMQLCTGTSTSPNVSCTFATSTPAADGAFPYHAYVKDWHDFAAVGNYKTNDYNVNNVAPVIGSVILHDSEDIILNMKGMDEVEATTTSTSISDNNGCLDIVNGGYATSTIYWSGLADEHNCAADPNNCYVIEQANCAVEAGSCTGASDADLTYICSTTIAYHALPTDNATGSPYTATNWLAGISVFDDDGLYGTATSSAGVEMITLVALEVSEATIPYNSVKSGQDTGDYNATTTIINFGNSPLDTGVDVNDMAKDDLTPNYIEAENQEFDLNNFTYGSGTWSVEQASSTFLVNTITIRPTSDTNVSDEIYWGIAIPNGKPSGTYTGQNIFTAILDDDNW